MRNPGVPPEHRSGGQCVSQHPTRGLEARADHQLDRVRIAVLVLGTQPGGPAEPRGSRSPADESAPVRAQRVQGDARQLHWRDLFRALSQVIYKFNTHPQMLRLFNYSYDWWTLLHRL